jgi:hypothetical protein
MAAWFRSALKAVLPHVGSIVQAAKPMFTKPKSESDALTPEILEQQIAEIQAVAAQNDANIRELAEQLRTLVTAIQDSSALAEAKLNRLRTWSMTALAVSIASMAISLISWVARG